MGRFPAVTFSILALLVHSAAGAADLDAIRARGSLRVLVGGTVEKFFTLGSETAPGMDREILEAFAHLQGLRLEIVQAPSWNAMVQWLADGKGDVAAGALTVTESRRQLIDFTPEIFPVRHVVVTLAPRPTVSTADQLRKERLGVQKGTVLREVVGPMEVDPSRLEELTGACPPALERGAVTACIVALDELVSEQRQNPLLRAGMLIGPSYSYAYGVRKDCPMLLRALSDHVNNVRRGGTWSRLVVKYFGEDALAALRAAR